MVGFVLESPLFCLVWYFRQLNHILQRTREHPHPSRLFRYWHGIQGQCDSNMWYLVTNYSNELFKHLIEYISIIRTIDNSFRLRSAPYKEIAVLSELAEATRGSILGVRHHTFEVYARQILSEYTRSPEGLLHSGKQTLRPQIIFHLHIFTYSPSPLSYYQPY